MTDQIEETRSISHVGPVPNVSVHAHMRSGPHAITADPLDLVVVVELMFLFGEQARRRQSDEPLVVTPQTVLERLREMGVRSGNGSRLVGRDAVYGAFARLRAKGYIRRIMESDETTGQRTGVAYEFYDWPAWNPDAPAISESSQVMPTSGNAGSGDAGSRARKRTKHGSKQVGATSGNAGSGDAGSSPSSQVGATSGNAGSPPLPPGGGGTTPPPNPLSNTDPAESPASQKDLDAAAEFLQQLPDPWEIGSRDAHEIAPQLLEQMHRQGWPLIGEIDATLLASCLTTNPGGMTNPASVLRRRRIPNLPAYGRVASRAAKRNNAPDEGMCLRHPVFRDGDCPPCVQEERQRAARGPSQPSGLAGDGAALLARLRAAQQSAPTDN